MSAGRTGSHRISSSAAGSSARTCDDVDAEGSHGLGIVEAALLRRRPKVSSERTPLATLLDVDDLRPNSSMPEMADAALLSGDVDVLPAERPLAMGIDAGDRVAGETGDATRGGGMMTEEMELDRRIAARTRSTAVTLPEVDERGRVPALVRSPSDGGGGRTSYDEEGVMLSKERASPLPVSRSGSCGVSRLGEASGD